MKGSIHDAGKKKNYPLEKNKTSKTKKSKNKTSQIKPHITGKTRITLLSTMSQIEHVVAEKYFSIIVAKQIERKHSRCR